MPVLQRDSLNLVLAGYTSCQQGDRSMTASYRTCVRVCEVPRRHLRTTFVRLIWMSLISPFMDGNGVNPGEETPALSGSLQRAAGRERYPFQNCFPELGTSITHAATCFLDNAILRVLKSTLSTRTRTISPTDTAS